jgi:copper(I)-binding protein
MHVMLIGLTEPLVEGNHFQLRLNFEIAGEVAVMVMINAEGALSMQNAGHGNHTQSTE